MAMETMRSLSIRTSSSRQHRRYLGDPNDPHHVPKSPLIERRKLSAQDEAELKRICSLALSEVPHSDEMMDDPFRYLGSHITVQAPKKPEEAQTQRVVDQQLALHRSRPLEHQTFSNDSSATPSDTSKRETLPTNVTTPMTTPGVTPGDMEKRLSDAVRGSQTSQPSTSKTEAKSSSRHPVYSFLKDPIPHTRPQFSATKSLTHLPNLSKNKSKNKSPDLSVRPDKTIINSDFNKSLPAIPQLLAGRPERVIEVEPTPKEKSNGITRMFKTVRLIRAQTSHEIPARGTSTDQHERLGTLNKLQSMSSPRKQKFSFASIFQKRPANNKRATVG